MNQGIGPATRATVQSKRKNDDYEWGGRQLNLTVPHPQQLSDKELYDKLWDPMNTWSDYRRQKHQGNDGLAEYILYRKVLQRLSYQNQSGNVIELAMNEVTDEEDYHRTWLLESEEIAREIEDYYLQEHGVWVEIPRWLVDPAETFEETKELNLEGFHELVEVCRPEVKEPENPLELEEYQLPESQPIFRGTTRGLQKAEELLYEAIKFDDINRTDVARRLYFRAGIFELIGRSPSEENPFWRVLPSAADEIETYYKEAYDIDVEVPRWLRDGESDNCRRISSLDEFRAFLQDKRGVDVEKFV